jgi:hypothetical protein
MDDLVFFSDSKDELHDWLWEVGVFISDELRLHLKEEASVVLPVSEGVPFLGCRVFRNLIRLKHGAKVRFFRKWRYRERQHDSGEIGEMEFQQCASSLLGHVRHWNTRNLRSAFFWGEGQGRL